MFIIKSSFARQFFAKFIHKEILGLSSLKRIHLRNRKARAQLATSILKRNISKLKLISTSSSSRFLSILQPLKNQIKNQYNGLWHGIPLLRREIANQEEINNYSMLDFFSDQQSCFVDEVHITSACKEKVALVIAARIARELKL